MNRIPSLTLSNNTSRLCAHIEGKNIAPSQADGLISNGEGTACLGSKLSTIISGGQSGEERRHLGTT
jgi:hypothetical protein